MAGPARSAPHALTGIALLVAAVACFAVLDTTTKIISLSVPLLMALWFRYAFQAVATTLAVLPKRGWALPRTAHPKFQCLRGVLLLSSSVFAFFSLKYMPVGEFTAIVMITPLLMTLLASFALNERVSWLRWLLVMGGFTGTLIIIRPGGEDFDWAMLLPLGLVVSNAWFQILTSRLARTEDPITMHFYTGWVGTLLASLALPFAWTWLDSWTLWAGLGLMGLMGTIGHFMMILAYVRTPVSTLTPFLYAQIGFAMLGGWLAFSHVPDHWSVLGMCMIALCGATGAWLAVRESRLVIQATES
ncbi:Threonine/homoserine efflux transporter RhtA [Polaromonas sp. OV174]|uniref:DMT family transporter n=1 Tax=Polaromonas sp. OV174 TaxID=1855300 RepID=UPI0008F04152|nr:DMT family transporter [Polaromonas sp. OV174]SFB81138.1 Threonine/homoserine efflux transporter RhtA [Polaromonas sp. OV174]